MLFEGVSCLYGAIAECYLILKASEKKLLSVVKCVVFLFFVRVRGLLLFFRWGLGGR
jgi:hypothetical protein